ncbi:MAG: hypothetical protein ACUVSF_09725 [Anaerolineae bacterium]
MAELAEADKDAQRAGSEIEVALNDPRWLVKEVAGTLSENPRKSPASASLVNRS